jgi:hypothetical protein
MRRHFGSHAAGLCARDGILKAIFGRDVWIANAASRCSGIVSSVMFRMEPAVK